MKKRHMTAALALAILPLAALADPLPPVAPLPFARPDAAGAKTAIDDVMKTGTVRPDDVAGLADDAKLMSEGLEALSQDRVQDALQIRSRLPAGKLERRILAWAIALSGDRALSSAQIAGTARELAGWPGMVTLREHEERALYRENPPPEAVLEALGDGMPLTYEGVVLLARAHLALGNEEAARAVLVPFWRARKLGATQEASIIREFAKLIPAADHRRRMEAMLYEDRIRSAERVMGLAGGEALTRAWAAVIRGEKNAGKLLEAVPEEQRSVGYLFAKLRYLRRQEHFREAAAMMLKAPRDAKALIDPDEWWIERRLLSRELLDMGEAETAYRIASVHAAESPARAADAEFVAGWTALRALGDAKTAVAHFARIAEIADGPISNARAYYWLGRAAEAGGPGTASAYYARAAEYGTAFYGQLAAARLGRSALTLANPRPRPEDRRSFAAREKVRAIKLLGRTGHARRAASLYRALAEQLETPGELALLVALAEHQCNHTQALRVGKIAAGRGLAIGALAHPLGAIPASTPIPPSRKALAYAVARQESEFNGGAVSPAGARGLLQLLPGTAREMAKRASLPYSLPRLTADPAYNAALGTAYLDEQLTRFGGSYILTFAGYNAGPRRAGEWMERYGDPRGRDIDWVVDWIERIPYAETRNYVQRVMENYQVYKMRLSGRFDIAEDLAAGG